MSRKQYPEPHNQCVECGAEAVDHHMVCAEHAPLYDDARMQRDIDRETKQSRKAKR